MYTLWSPSPALCMRLVSRSVCSSKYSKTSGNLWFRFNYVRITMAGAEYTWDCNSIDLRRGSRSAYVRTWVFFLQFVSCCPRRPDRQIDAFSFSFLVTFVCCEVLLFGHAESRNGRDRRPPRVTRWTKIVISFTLGPFSSLSCISSPLHC
jgi:hypothetical protein